MEIIKLLITLLIITILFIIYSEYSVGQILFRPDSSGKISMNLNSLINYLMNPFYNKYLWTWETLDINFAFVLIYSLFIYAISIYLFSNIFYNNGELGVNASKAENGE